MKTYEEVNIWIHVFLTWAVVGGEWSSSSTGRFTFWERAPDRRLGGPRIRSRRHGEEKFFLLMGLEPGPLGRPARSQSLYRLHYLCSTSDS
jgi:hypothetical protein